MGWYSEHSEKDSFTAPKEKVKTKFKNYFVNDGPKLVWIVLWVLATLAVFFERFLHYYLEKDTNDPHAFQRFGHGWPRLTSGVTLARGAAAALKLQSALLLITVLRNTWALLRRTPLHHLIPVDKMIVFHRHIGWAAAFFVLPFLHFVISPHSTPPPLTPPGCTSQRGALLQHLRAVGGGAGPLCAQRSDLTARLDWHHCHRLRGPHVQLRPPLVPSLAFICRLHEN